MAKIIYILLPFLLVSLQQKVSLSQFLGVISMQYSEPLSIKAFSKLTGKFYCLWASAVVKLPCFLLIQDTLSKWIITGKRNIKALEQI